MTPVDATGQPPARHPLRLLPSAAGTALALLLIGLMVLFAVVRLVLRLWRNDLRRMLGGSTLNTQLLLWCAAAVMVAWEVFGSSWLLGSSRDTLQQIGRSRDAAQLATLTVTCMAASFASPLLLITPAATALEHLLAPMPL